MTEGLRREGRREMGGREEEEEIEAVSNVKREGERERAA